MTSTKYSIGKLELRVKEELRPWFNRREVGGYVETYDKGLTFATVRNAGHQVPVSARDDSLALFAHFLSGTSLPASS